MKKTLILILMPFLLSSQIKKGTVKYSVNVPFDEKLSKFFAPDHHTYVNKLEFNLKFNQNESIFEVIDNNLSDQLNSKFLVSGTKATGVYYKENKDSLLLLAKDNEEFGKLIIQIDNNVKWNLLNETKNIDGNICYKATSEIWFYAESFKKITKIEAWYCPTIPAQFGPKCFGGLPGLILELVNGGVTFKAIEIKLNPNEEVLIKKPKDGNLITNLEYKKLIDDFYADVMAGKK
jgi:GLPGLI family protein